MLRRIRSRLAPVFFVLVLAPLVSFSPAFALDIAGIELLWLQDRVDGTPVSPFSYGMEAVVIVDDTSGLGSMRLVTPTGTHGLTQVASDEFEVSFFYANSTDLFTALPGVGTYTFEFLDGTSTVIDSYSIVLGAGDLVEVTDFLDVTAPIHQGTLPVNGTIDWTCVLCDGEAVEVDAVHLASDVEIDRFVGPAASGSWNPSGIVVGQDYESEVMLVDYFDNDAALELTAALDDFQALVGYESINLVEWTGAAAVPEPGTAALLAGGLLGLTRAGQRRRERRRSA